MDAARAPLPETAPPEWATPDRVAPDRVAPDPVRRDAGPEQPETAPDGAGATGGPAVGGPELSDRERDILAFERHWFRYAGAKEQAIRTEFGLSATRYYQLLNAVIDKPAALVTDPMLVRRLRRLRAERRRARAERPRPAGI